MSACQDLPSLVWDQKLGMAMIGNFQSGRLALTFSAGMAVKITSDQFVLEVV